jgi:hypothetical protein
VWISSRSSNNAWRRRTEIFGHTDANSAVLAGSKSDRRFKYFGEKGTLSSSKASIKLEKGIGFGKDMFY